MPLRQLVYLALSLGGLGSTWYHNLAFARETGSLDMGAFIAAAGANHAAQSIGWDITFGAAAFSVFVMVEGRRLGMKRPWVYLVLTFGIAFAFAAPLFLFMRERALTRATPSAE